MKIFVVFGSKSDEGTALPLVESLKKFAEVEYEAISAHRDLDKLHAKMHEWKGDAVVAGAGLAAALPGVVAAMVKIPVFGVAVPSQFGGLDSFASIAQMPPGVPVMTAGPQKPSEIPAFLKQYGTARVDYSRINFVAPSPEYMADAELIAEIEKARTAAKEKGIEVKLTDMSSTDGAFDVRLVAESVHIHPGELCLHVPLMSKSHAQKPESYLQLVEWANKGGLWVGCNNTRNAVASVARLGASAKVSKEKAA
jgi:5-(carboxyamino)imidazole ribonucleotide mutase